MYELGAGCRDLCKGCKDWGRLMGRVRGYGLIVMFRVYRVGHVEGYGQHVGPKG